MAVAALAREHFPRAPSSAGAATRPRPRDPTIPRRQLLPGSGGLQSRGDADEGCGLRRGDEEEETRRRRGRDEEDEEHHQEDGCARVTVCVFVCLPPPARCSRLLPRPSVCVPQCRARPAPGSCSARTSSRPGPARARTGERAPAPSGANEKPIPRGAPKQHLAPRQESRAVKRPFDCSGFLILISLISENTARVGARAGALNPSCSLISLPVLNILQGRSPNPKFLNKHWRASPIEARPDPPHARRATAAPQVRRALQLQIPMGDPYLQL